MLDMNSLLIEQALLRFIRDSIHKNGFKNGILGVSGGLDSAVVLALTQKALGPDHTFALLMPYKLSSPHSREDGASLCRSLGIETETVDITPMVDAYFSRFPTDDRVAVGNMCARQRMTVLFDFSVRKQALVVGTSNKSELLIGYSTLYGDSAAAFLPIGDLYKTQVFELARHLGIPESIIAKKPSADLWEGQTDEGEFGLTYAEIDLILYQLIDLRRKPEEIAATGITAERIEQVERLIRQSQFKRTLPPVAKLQPRTVGIDFRYPRDWNR